jgi:hypothetical protein
MHSCISSATLSELRSSEFASVRYEKQSDTVLYVLVMVDTEVLTEGAHDHAFTIVCTHTNLSSCKEVCLLLLNSPFVLALLYLS